MKNYNYQHTTIEDHLDTGSLITFAVMHSLVIGYLYFHNPEQKVLLIVVYLLSVAFSFGISKLMKGLSLLPFILRIISGFLASVGIDYFVSRVFMVGGRGAEKGIDMSNVNNVANQVSTSTFCESKDFPEWARMCKELAIKLFNDEAQKSHIESAVTTSPINGLTIDQFIVSFSVIDLIATTALAFLISHLITEYKNRN